MSGFDNFWNFKTILNQGEPAIDEGESKPGPELRINVPFLSCLQLPSAGVYQASEEDNECQDERRPVARKESFDEDLQKLEHLTLTELHELRRKIARHSHPDLKFSTGVAANYDLMSEANGLIDDEIKSRS